MAFECLVRPKEKKKKKDTQSINSITLKNEKTIVLLCHPIPRLF